MFYIQRRYSDSETKGVLYRGQAGKWVPLEQIDEIEPFQIYINASQTMMQMEGRCEIFAADLIIAMLLKNLRISNNRIKQIIPVRGPETLGESSTTPEQAIAGPLDRPEGSGLPEWNDESGQRG